MDKEFRTRIEGELSIGVASGSELLDVTAVVGLAASHGHEAGLLVHHLVDLVKSVATLALQVAHGSRVDGTAAGTHHDAVERRQAHGGVHALPVLDGAQGSAGANVAHDDLAGLEAHGAGGVADLLDLAIGLNVVSGVHGSLELHHAACRRRPWAGRRCGRPRAC